MNLITDRTQADVARVRALVSKGWGEMTLSEKNEFLGGLKGAYNATDLNRVESAVAYLQGLLLALPDELREYAVSKDTAWSQLFDVPYDPEEYRDVAVKTDWIMPDLPQAEDMARYLSNVALIKTALSAAYPPLPQSMERLTADAANAIERTLALLGAAIAQQSASSKDAIDRTAAAWYYSGEIQTGEV